MENFLYYLSVYNAKAAAAITLAVTEGNSPKANLMSSLKTTANDTTLSDDVRLEALTALINIGNLLDIPLPPYFPIVTTYADSQTYVGVHNDLSGLNVGDYQHLTAAEKVAALNKASLTDISFSKLQGIYTQNDSLVAGFATKQDALNGTGYVKASGGTITYDNSTFLTTTLGVAKAETPGGELSGTYATPTLNNGAVIGKVLTGFNGSAPTGTITGSDSILSAVEKLNANVNDIASTAGTINEITFTLPSSVFDYTAGPFTSGTAAISGSFINQTQSTFFAAPSSGGSGQPYFRTIVAGDLPTSGATAGSYGSSSTIPVLTVDAYGRITNISNVASASGGQVNTISYSVPFGLFNSSVTGTTDVSITLGVEPQQANYVWAGPSSGGGAAPQFRALVVGDMPTGIPIANISGLQSALDSKMNYLLNDGEIWIGNASNAPTNKSLTGDVTMTREGVVTIEPNVVDFGKMQQITGYNAGQPGNLLGRYSSGIGDIQEVNLNPLHFSLDNTTGTLSLASPPTPILNSKGGLITYRQSIGQPVQLPAVFDGNLLITDSGEDDGLKWVTAQGDIEVDAALDGTFNITAGAVSLAKMANLAANSIIGNNTGSAATPIALTPAQVTAMLNLFNTSSTVKGLVPGSNGVGNTYYLDATGNWSIPAGGGGGGTTTFALTMDNSGSGAASGSTFNGSAAKTISYNTIGAPKYDGTGASGTWGIDISGNAATVTNGLYSTGSYSNPSWLTSIQGSIVSGNISGNAANITATSNSTLTTLSALSLPGSQVSGNISGSAGSVANSLTIGSGLSGSASTYNGSAAVTVSLNVGNANTWTALQTFRNNIYLGEVGTGSGSARFIGSTSGYVALQAAAAAGTQTYTLPTAYPAASTGYYLTSNTSGTLSWAAGATGDVTGPSGATANAIAVYNGTTGKIIKDSGVTFPITVSNGGIGITSGASGGIPYFDTTTSIASSAALAANALVVGGGAGIAPSTITTGTGVVTALGVNVGTAGSFITNGGALGTPASGNFSSGTFTWPTFNQNTTGSAASLTTARNIQTDLSSTSAASFNGTANITPGITGTLGFANGGTGQTSYTDGQLLIGNTSTGGLTKATLTAGSNITITNAGGSITIAATGGSGSGTVNSATLGAIAYYAATGTAVSGTTNLYVDNSNGRINIGAFTAPNARVQVSAGTASVPQFIATPSSLSGALTGTTNGSMWYDTTSGTNSSLYLYKDSGLTKFITKDRNADFATGSNSGVIVSDTSGTLTKSADLTALGIFAQTSTVTVANTTTPTTLIGTVTGSATLPANFFAVGKTIVIYVTGTYNTILSPSCVLTLTIGGVSMGSITITHNNPVTNGYYNAQFVLTCRTTGATGTIQYSGIGILNTGTVSASSFFQNSATSGSFDTTSAQAINLTATWNALSVSNSITASILTAQYLN